MKEIIIATSLLVIFLFPLQLTIRHLAKLKPDNLVSQLIEYRDCFGQIGIKNDLNVILNKTRMIFEGIV